ncbi:methylthioribulose 1-phosphate dehydratase [Salinibius halmophilus]|uniref:methylthioribulose 1-phosphate dehydratase n=1 Tax=Salinibius halmophilus TaxID=1853216 RepID=UPI000E665BE7|nr:methylthioribulose 1-phosphate dehydratase [Salinibius halmophilus]
MAFEHSISGLTRATQYFASRGWTPAAAGNFSLRKEAEIWVSESGVYKAQISESDFIVVDEHGKAVAQRTPSAETELHCQIYQLHRDVQCVLHTHSVASTVLSMALGAMESLPLRGYEVLKAFPHISSHEQSLLLPIFENSQTMADIAQAFANWRLAHPECCAYIIRGHGIYTWATDVDTCVRQIEALEFLLECELQRLQLK